MRLVSAIVALCVVSGAYLIILIDRRHERIRDPRRASRRAVTGSKIIALAGLILLAWAATADARPAHHTGRPHAWCGWWLGQHLGMPDRHLWVARNWAKVGSSSGGPHVGAIVVWRHHVGIITGRNALGWIVKSGNDGHRVRERVRSVSGAIAFRRV